MSNLRANSFIKKVLYQLKKLNGQTVDLYLRGTVSTNYSTGQITYPETLWSMRKIPMLPIEAARQLVQNPPFATAGRQFEYGTFFVTGTSMLIVDQKSLPLNYVVNQTDSFVIDHRRYTIKSAQEFQQLQAVLFVIEELKGQPVDEIFTVQQSIAFTQTVVQS